MSASTLIVVDRSTPSLILALLSAPVPRSLQGDSETLARLEFHRTVLESAGLTDLAGLGNLSLEGNVVPQPGLTSPGAVEVFGAPTLFQSAFRLQVGDTTRLESIGGEARLLRSQPFAFPLAATTSVDIAYWAASWIDLADDTTIVFTQPNLFLTIITEKLTVGKNVTFTYQRPTPSALPNYAQRKAAPKKDQAPTPDGLWGVTGEEGASGTAGNRGPDGTGAPELELWTLEMTGSPSFDLRGQDGFQGGRGEDGGDGGDGSKGRDAQLGFLGFCKSGPGNGGDGGTGGRAGDGGQGGNGGSGGRLSLFAPQPVLAAYAQGFSVSIDGGSPGAGGTPGVPGDGGEGGQVGNNPHNCRSSDPRTAGNSGAQGAPGNTGAPGWAGLHSDGSIRMKSIEPNDLRRALETPQIISFSPDHATQGEMVTATGLRFMNTDTVVLNGLDCVTRVVSDTLLTFEVPIVQGGAGAVQVRQDNETMSNKASLYVLPVLAEVPRGKRISPGSLVTLKGSGFAPGMRVQLNGQDMPTVRFNDASSLDFTSLRPSTTRRNASGERVKARVVLADGTPSGEVDLVLDTFRMVTLGDSVMWGQGLQENEKIDALIAAKIQEREGNIGFYRHLLAHSGAAIGVGDATNEKGLNGEVPTSYPTILQQCDGFDDSPGTVDFVLLNGGINDVNVRQILNPFSSANDISDLTQKHCHDDLKTLLESVARKFPQAQIIVLGYYQLISDDSDLALLGALLIAAGVWVGGAIGGVAFGVVGAAEKATIAANCLTFATQSKRAMQAAVDETNAELGATRLFFADPGFGPQNAALASAPLLFGINADLSPQDNLVAGARALACEVAGAHRTDVPVCKRASMGHPNAIGAQRYADAILAAQTNL